MNATLLCVALLVPGYGEKDIIKQIEARGAGVDPDGSRVLWLQATDADLVVLCELHNLKALATGGRVTDEGLRTLPNLCGLNWIWLGGEHITDKGLRHLESVRGLERLDLRCCPKVTDEGVARLQKALPKCKILH